MSKHNLWHLTFDLQSQHSKSQPIINPPNHEHGIIKPYNKVILYRFLKQLDLLLLIKGIKRKFLNFSPLIISYMLKAQKFAQ